MINPSDILHGSILIVDDQDANVILLERILRGAGYDSIYSTTDPHKVFELHRKNNFDLILLDVQMPGMDGFQVMERLKTIETGHSLPVLVITSQPDYKLRALQAGAKDFISKPFEFGEVLARVHNMIEVRLLQKEIADHKEDNPALSSVIQRNIRQIIQVRRKAARESNLRSRMPKRIRIVIVDDHPVALQHEL